MTKGKWIHCGKDDDDNDNFKIFIIPCTLEISAEDNIKKKVFQKFRMVLKHYISILREED
jgi:hypothetical protein